MRTLMNKKEFLTQLRRKISTLPREERDSAIEFYENYFNDAISEEEAIKNLGSIDEIAANLIMEFGESKKEDYKNNKNSTQNDSKKSSSWVVVLLAILSAPITLPLGIASLALIGALIILIVSVLFTIALAILGFMIGSFISLFAVIPAFLFSFPTGCFFLGFFFAGTGFAYFLIKVLVLTAKKCLAFVQDLISKLLHRRYKNEAK